MSERESKADRFLAALQACGWFEALPAAIAEQARASLAAADSYRLWKGLVASVADSAYLLEEAPWAALLAQFALESHGAFAPQAIEETLAGATRRLQFSAAGRGYTLDLPAEADEVPQAFYDSINQAMEQSGTPLRFLEIHQLGWGPIPGFALAHPDAFAKAVKAKLIPASEEEEEISEEELDGFAATIQTALLGSETYCWTLEGEVVGQIVVPGEHDEDTDDERAKGQGLQTILGYEGCGTLLLMCAGPADGFLTLPKDFAQEEAVERPDRSTLLGRATISGKPTRWRLDKIKGAPVHLLYTVTETMAARFATALDSFRLQERTPKAEAIFASCLVEPPPKKKTKRR